MSDYKGIAYLQRKLAMKRPRVLLRYAFYEQKQRAKDFGISTPEGLEWFQAVNGWCTKAVDGLADRLQFDGFEDDTFMMQDMFNLNNPDIIFDSALLSALISSCSFFYISRGEDGPRIQVIDGANATGIIDDQTNLLTEGYAVLSRDEFDQPLTYAYFQRGETWVYQAGITDPIAHESTGAEYAALVPVIYKPDARRPFGHSRISRSCMSIALSAMRTVKRSEIAAEFYSFPQKYATGLSQDAEVMDSWKATMSAMLSFTRDDEGNSPTLGQFQQQSMQPHVEQLKAFASMFAGETGLTVDDLGFNMQNPSSAEAIKASHETLRLAASKAQRCFGSSFINAGFIAACVRDNFAYKRAEVFKTRAEWLPVFEPDAAMMSAIGDGIIKLNQAIPDYIDEKRMHRLTGIR
jgi:hypothetical protein